jgi:uracil-DNA glycosylase
MPLLSKAKMTLLVGIHAQACCLRDARKATMTETVRDFSVFAPNFFPLPHPSRHSTDWMRRNPWFEAEVLPALCRSVRSALGR